MDTTSSTHSRRGVDPAFVFLLLLTLSFWSIVFFRPLFFGGDDWFTFYHLATKKSSVLLDYLFTSHGDHFYPFTLGFVLIQLVLFGLHYWPFQAVSILIHLAVTALLTLLLSRHVSNRPVLLLSAAFFSINAAYYPQAVGWVMGQSTMLSLLFVLAALLALERYRDGRRVCLILCLLFCVLSAFSSASGLIAPLVVLVYLWLFRRRETSVPAERTGIAVPVLVLIIAQIALTVFYFLILEREHILIENPYFLSFGTVRTVISLVSAGVLALLFTSAGGKMLLLIFNVDPIQLLKPLSLPFPLIAVMGLIAFLGVLAVVYCCTAVVKDRNSFRRRLSDRWRIALFGILFILMMYGIRAVGRMDTHTITDFMLNHQYRYETTAGLALIVAFILASIQQGFSGNRTRAFKRALIALGVGFLIVVNLPAVWAGGQEYPQDRVFIAAFRGLLNDRFREGGAEFPDLPYTFHDDIQSTFFISDIQKMVDRNLTGVAFKDDMSVHDIRDEQIRRFYLTYFPKQLTR